MEESIQQLNQLFPAHKEKINQLYMEKGDFFDLCNDYNACLNHLRQWENDPSPDLVLVKEYRVLLEDLEEEIKLFLKKK